MQNEPHREQEAKIDPEILAKCYKFYKQKLIPDMLFRLPMERIPSKTLYNDYRKYFDRLAFICEKYKINHFSYIEFCVMKLGIRNPDEILRTDNFINYANDKKIEKEYKRIFDHFMKTANYVADKCIEMNITPREYILYLINSNKLAIEHFCGNISSHYLASIRGIKNIYNRLDNISREQLSIIFDVTEKLNQDTQEAFLRFKNKTVSPLKLSETIINNKQTKTTNKQK